MSMMEWKDIEHLISYQLGIINLLRLFQHLSVFSDENEREREQASIDSVIN